MKFKQFIIESAEVAYHGTSSIRLKEILKNGFDLKHVGEKADAKLSGISVTVDKTIAKEHAEWAVEKFGGEESILKIDLNGLKIMSGKEVHELWDKLGSLDAAIKIARKTFDAAELFDHDLEYGLEEFEILIFDPKKVKIIK